MWADASYAMTVRLEGQPCVSSGAFDLLRKKNFSENDALDVMFDKKDNTIIKTRYHGANKAKLVKDWQLTGEACQELPELIYFWLEREQSSLHQMKRLEGRNTPRGSRTLDLYGEQRSRLRSTWSIGLGGSASLSPNVFGGSIPLVFETNVRNRIAFRGQMRLALYQPVDLDVDRLQIGTLSGLVGFNVFLSDSYARRNTRKGLGLHLLGGITLERAFVMSDRTSGSRFRPNLINPSMQLGFDYRFGEMPVTLSLGYQRQFIQTAFVGRTSTYTSPRDFVLFDIRYHFFFANDRENATAKRLH